MKQVVESRFRLGDWIVDPAGNRLSRDGEEVRLEPKAMEVLVFLAQHHRQVVKRRELEAGIWPGMIVSDDAVTNAVLKLRRALGDKARNPRYIETIAKSGYRLISDVGSPDPAATPSWEETSAKPPTQTSRRGPRGLQSLTPRFAKLIPAFLTSIPFIALAVGWWLTHPPKDEPASAPGHQRPVVAVLPFENLSGEPERDYFANGITEDLITDLSKVSGLQVVARNSVMAYRDNKQAGSRIARELGADYLVRGSVQRAGQRLRINVRLVDPGKGRYRWAERYDRRLDDIFRIQDEIAKHVVAALSIELSPEERLWSGNTYVTSVEAYDQYLQGLDLLGRRTSADNPEARQYFRRAIALDPAYARAYGGLALTYALHALYGHGPEVSKSLDTAEAIVRKGLALDADLPQLRYALGFIEMYRGNLAAASTEVSRAIEIRPSYADGFGLLAWILHFAGRPHDGLDAMRKAVALNPHVPALYLTVEGALHYQLGNLDQAERLLLASIEANPNQLLTRLFLCAVYAASGEMDAARWQVEEIYALEPGYKVNLEYGLPIRDPQYRSRFLADLGSAGLTHR